MSGLIPPALLFPRFVGEPTSDMTDCHSHNATIIDLKKQISQDVSYILYTEAALTAAIFLAMILYFPAHPPSPPSPSATAHRYKLKEGLKNIFFSYKNVLVGKQNSNFH